MTVTEAAVERAFSRHKIVHTRLRANLKTENLETQLFILYNFGRTLKNASEESKTEDVEGEILTWLRNVDIDCIHFLRICHFFLRMLDAALDPANGLLDPISSWMCSIQQLLHPCWWVLFSLQHCVWSHGLLLPLLPLSRTASFSHWRRYSTWEREERARCNETTLYTRERLQGYWNVGVRTFKTVQNNQYCWKKYSRRLSSQAFACSWTTFRRDKGSKVILISAVRYWSTWKVEVKIC